MEGVSIVRSWFDLAPLDFRSLRDFESLKIVQAEHVANGEKDSRR